jgi:hypothetical protein
MVIHRQIPHSGHDRADRVVVEVSLALLSIQAVRVDLQ